MIQQSYLPGPHLQKWIREYVLVHLEIDKNQEVPVKPYPANPEQGITFYVRGFVKSIDSVTGFAMRRPPAVVFGQPISRQNLQPTHQYLMVDVRFQPGALYGFIRLPLTEFLHKNIDAELIFGKEINMVNDQLADAPDYASILRIVDAWLFTKIRRIKEEHHPFEKISRLIQDDPQSFSLEKIARQACMSASQFERKFQSRTGVTPKFFSRICRFHQAFELKTRRPALDWLSIAVQTGYSDYQHLVKDFKQFSGAVPNGLMEDYTRSVERWQATGLIPNFV